jgi:O-antigen/teichoic acid export membrane protein
MLKNGIYNLVSGFIRAGLAFIAVPILISLMGLQEYGVWALVSSILGALLLAEAGLSVSTTTFVSEDLARQNKKSLSETLGVILVSVLVLATLAAFLLWLGAESIVTLFPKLNAIQKQTIIHSLHIGAVGLWAQLIQLVLIGVEQSYQCYALVNLLKTTQWIFLTLGWFAIAWSGGRTLALAQWQSLSMLLGMLTHSYIVIGLTQRQVFQLAFNRQRAIEILRYTAPTWAGIMGGTLFTRIDRLVVGSLLGSSLLGIYSAMIDFTSAINFFSAQSIQPLLPSVSFLLAETPTSNRVKLIDTTRQAVRLNAYIATCCGGVMLVFTPQILSNFLHAASNSKDVLVFQLLVIIVTLYSLNATGYFLLFSIKRVLEHASIQIASGLISLTLIFWGASHFKLFGAILGNVGFLISLLFPILAFKYLGFSPRLFVTWIWMPMTSFLGIGLMVIFSLDKILVIFWLSVHVISCLTQLGHHYLLVKIAK